MNPSLANRLSSMAKAMEDVVIPALRNEDGIALEQAGIVLAHLRMAAEQEPYTAGYEHICLADAESVAHTLIASASAGFQSLPALAVLETVLNGSGEGRYSALTQALEALVREAHEAGLFSLSAPEIKLTLWFSQRQADRDRAWFAAAGFDWNRDALPSLSDLTGTDRWDQYNPLIVHQI
jgi:hypothetical protein